MENSKTSAFPFVETEAKENVSEGLSKREYAAIKIFSAIVPSLMHEGHLHYGMNNVLIKECCEAADELLKQLEK